MEKNKEFYFECIEGVPANEKLELLAHLYAAIFSTANCTFFKERIRTKENVLSILAFYNKQPVGFKVGYFYKNQTFYSWVGGVLIPFRRQGIAKLQEDWARQQGFTKIRTKSMNDFKPMMILNLKNDFDIKTIYTNEHAQTKIVFEKNLVLPSE